MGTKKLAEGWKEVELGNDDYFTLLSSGINKFQGKKDYLSTESIQGTRIIKIEDIISYGERPSRANMQPVLNSIWFAKMQSTLKVYSFNEINKNEIEKYILSTGFAGIKVNEKLVDTEYLRLLFTSEEFNKLKDKLCTGSTQRGINNQFIKKISLIIPPIQIQKKIVAILEKAEKAKEWRKEADDLTKDFLKSIFKEMFGQGKYATIRINEVVTKIKTENPVKDYPNQFFDYVDISSIDNKQGKIIETRKVLGKDAPSRAKQKVNFNDLIISTVRPNLNSVALVPKILDQQICSTGFCVLRADKNKVVPEYLYQIARSSRFIESMVKIAKGASYPAVSDRNIKNYEIILPPIELQNKFTLIVKEVEVMNKYQNKSKQELDNFFNILMQKAFKGELV
ncbi:MAG: restriction endonuclease subunit S [Nanoarchaeota archaeon]|nr:restriction endonuclease subunit S [Nanoarchaeota archaeon]MBU1622430.1 restriction endonuclease subunit S [Nanoarchaeota archaeon]